MLQDLLNLNLFAFFMIFVRVGTALAFMPGFAASYVNLRVRLHFALATALALTPLLAGRLPVVPTDASLMVLIIAAEALIGLFFAALMRGLMFAVVMAGTIMSFVSSFANALTQDAIAESQSSIISGFLNISAIVVVFVTDTHHLMLAAVVESYEWMAPGSPIMVGDMADLLARHIQDAALLGVRLAAPLIVVGMVYNILIGLLSRLMPALPVFFFGIPIQMMAQFAVLALAFSSIMLVFIRFYEDRLMSIL